MQSQAVKLVVLLNVCFWIAVSFAVWRYTASLPQEAVSTTLVLGSVAWPCNLWYWIARLRQKKNALRPTNRWVQSFILLSTIMQTAGLFYFLS